MCKVLFVASGNKFGKVGAVVKNQAISIMAQGNVEVDFFLIKGKGLAGYFKNVLILRKHLKRKKYDLVHAHGLSCITATLSFFRPLVVSLLGSELHENSRTIHIFRLMSRHIWAATIVKSATMYKLMNGYKNKKTFILPNGVDLSRFSPEDILKAKEKTGFSKQKSIILFLANPSRQSKNFELAKKAVSFLSDKDIELKVVHNYSTDKIPEVINSSDIVLLTSRWEGSPNVVKEAMACNRPVVSTYVGDVEWLFGNLEGYYISDSTPESIADNIKKALQFCTENKTTNGRERIIQLELDTRKVAEKIMGIYSEIINSKKV